MTCTGAYEQQRERKISLLFFSAEEEIRGNNPPIRSCFPIWNAATI